MKKFVSVLLILLLVCSLVGCENSDNKGSNSIGNQTAVEQKTPMEDVQEKIEKIGFVSDASVETKQKLLDAERAYENLSSADKTTVSNYDKLKLARKHFDYYELKDNAISKAENDLLSKLKNPQSLQVHSHEVWVGYDSNGEYPIAFQVQIEYSAQNGFGGYNRTTHRYVCKIEGKSFIKIGSAMFASYVNEQNGICIFNSGNLDKLN